MEVRPVRPDDLAAVVEMVHELAAYEKAPDSCHLTVDRLRAALFGARPALYGHVALDTEQRPVGFALWFLNFSTWEGTHGIYLEDLYVRPGPRGSGLGRALLAALATVCVERGYARMDWSMLDWNPARGFYAAVGAQPQDEWVSYRLTGPALTTLADAAAITASGDPTR